MENKLVKSQTLFSVHRPATRSHKNGDLNICRKYTRMVPLRELKVLSAVSSHEDLTQLEDGNGISIITEFNPLSSTSQDPKNLPRPILSYLTSVSHIMVYFLLYTENISIDSVLFHKRWNA